MLADYIKYILPTFNILRLEILLSVKNAVILTIFSLLQHSVIILK